jgi:hypothetical protein
MNRAFPLTVLTVARGFSESNAALPVMLLVVVCRYLEEFMF